MNSKFKIENILYNEKCLKYFIKLFYKIFVNNKF